jgi:hypothetical protein
MQSRRMFITGAGVALSFPKAAFAVWDKDTVKWLMDTVGEAIPTIFVACLTMREDS